MMANSINNISINNFKSIRNLEITGFRRINLFIGRPNVGKSNILEALSVFSIPFFREGSFKKITNVVRMENEAELFYNGNIQSQGSVQIDNGNAILSYHPKEGLKIDIQLQEYSQSFQIDEKLNIKTGRQNKYIESPIKKYVYKSDIIYKKGHSKYLIPPFGSNLFSIIDQYKELREQIKSLFSEYGLEIAFDKSSQTIKIIQSKSNDKDEIFLIPYNSIADTLQRIIFYKSAIASNENSVLLFEEPEAHSFPPYMSFFTQEMIHNRNNQYIVATHSPFILNDLLENSREDLSIYLVHYKDFETKVKQLSDKELHDVFQYGVDLFTNSESFI